MRIVQGVGWYYPEHLGGTEVYVAALARTLRSRGHDVWVASPDPEGVSVREYMHDDTPVFRYPVARPARRAEARGDAPLAGAHVFHEWMGRMAPDVVHLHTFVPGLNLPEVRAAGRASARVVATSHAASLGYLCERGTLLQWGQRVCDARVEPGKCAACALHHRGLPRPVARLLARVPDGWSRAALAGEGPTRTMIGMRALVADNDARQRRLLEACHAFVVLSAWARDAMVANGWRADRIHVNRLCATNAALDVPGARGAGAGPRGPLRLGYVGRLQDIKGVDILVGAVAALPPEVSLDLTIVAPINTLDDRRERAVLAIRAAEGGRTVRFVPAVDREAVAPLLASFDLICCPSRAIEGGPTVALEAMAVGTPVVGSAVPALTEIVTHGVNGWLVPPGDVSALSSAIARIAADRTGTIDQWRTRLPPTRTMDDVADEYERLYEGRA